MDDDPLDRLHQLVPPLEVTATAFVGYGIFKLGQAIFRAPIGMTILGCLGVLLFGAFHEGMSLYELWSLALGLVVLVSIVFMVGFFVTGQPLFGCMLLGCLIFLGECAQSDHGTTAATAEPSSSSHWVLWVLGAIVLIVVGVVAHSFYCCHLCDVRLEAQRRAAHMLPRKSG